MTFWTMLMIKVGAGQGKAAAEAHIKRRATEEAAETIPGFRQGEVMLSASEPDLVCVLCGWEDEKAYQQWLDSPVRAKQATDLAGVMAGEVKTLTFQGLHSVAKPQPPSA